MSTMDIETLSARVAALEHMLDAKHAPDYSSQIKSISDRQNALDRTVADLSGTVMAQLKTKMDRPAPGVLERQLMAALEPVAEELVSVQRQASALREALPGIAKQVAALRDQSPTAVAAAILRDAGHQFAGE